MNNEFNNENNNGIDNSSLSIFNGGTVDNSNFVEQPQVPMDTFDGAINNNAPELNIFGSIQNQAPVSSVDVPSGTANSTKEEPVFVDDDVEDIPQINQSEEVVSPEETIINEENVDNVEQPIDSITTDEIVETTQDSYDEGYTQQTDINDTYDNNYAQDYDMNNGYDDSYTHQTDINGTYDNNYAQDYDMNNDYEDSYTQQTDMNGTYDNNYAQDYDMNNGYDDSYTQNSYDNYDSGLSGYMTDVEPEPEPEKYYGPKIVKPELHALNDKPPVDEKDINQLSGSKAIKGYLLIALIVGILLFFYFTSGNKDKGPDKSNPTVLYAYSSGTSMTYDNYKISVLSMSDEACLQWKKCTKKLKLELELGEEGNTKTYTVYADGVDKKLDDGKYVSVTIEEDKVAITVYGLKPIGS